MPAESEVQKTTSEIVNLAIAITIIGIVVGVGILVQSQFEGIAITKGNEVEYVDIPSGLELGTYSPYIQTLVILSIIAMIVVIVFGWVIPKIRGAAGGAGPAPT